MNCLLEYSLYSIERFGRCTLSSQYDSLFPNDSDSFIEIKFTYHTIHPLKVYNAVFLNIFTGLCNHHHNLVLEHFFLVQSVNEKLISRSKKELENFIQAKFGDYNPGRAFQKALRTVLPFRSQGTVI